MVAPISVTMLFNFTIMATNVPNTYLGPLLNTFAVPRLHDNIRDFKGSDLYKAAEFADSDAMNYYNSEMASFRDILKWQATNEWNLQQWYRENEYNSPKEQMLRYLEAGINPLWAMADNSNPGLSQQLTSQQPGSTSPIPFSMDAERLSQEREMFAQSNALASTQTMGDLSIKERALQNEITRTSNDYQKTKAQIELLKSQLESNDFLNRINSVTFDTQVNLKIEELNRVRQEISNLRSQEDLTNEQEKYLEVQEEYQRVLKTYTEAMAKKVESETFDKLENLNQRWYALITSRIQANAAATSSAAAMQQANTADAALHHQIERDTAELQLKSNEQIIQLIDMQRGVLDKMIGSVSNFAETITSGSEFTGFHRALSLVQSGYSVISKRFYDNPTKANADAMDKAQKLIDKLTSKPLYMPMPGFNSTNSSVVNPSGSDW